MSTRASVVVIAALSAVACSGRSSDESASETGQELSTYSQTINATAFTTKLGCGVASGSWYWQECNGQIRQGFTFPTSANYTLSVTAYGTPGGGQYPNMHVELDGWIVLDGNANVHITGSPQTFHFNIYPNDLIDYSTYQFSPNHSVWIYFSNDYCCSGGDRNLAIGNVTITRAN
jgi:hypothetical protein